MLRSGHRRSASESRTRSPGTHVWWKGKRTALGSLTHSAQVGHRAMANESGITVGIGKCNGDGSIFNRQRSPTENLRPRALILSLNLAPCGVQVGSFAKQSLRAIRHYASFETGLPSGRQLRRVEAGERNRNDS